MTSSATIVRRRTLAALVALVALALGGALPAPAGAQASTQRGVAQFEGRRYADARGTLSAAFNANGRDARAAYYLGRIALVEGDGEAGATWLERAVKLDGGRSAYHHWLGRAYSRQAVRASRMTQARLAGKIRGSFEKAVALDPDNVDARSDLLSYYVIAPGFMGGSREKARQQAAEIRRRNPLRGRIAFAAVAEDARDMAGAEREMIAATTEHPDSTIGWYTLGGFYTRTGQWDRATAVFERLAKRSGEGAALYHIGRTASMSGRNLDRGVEALRGYLARTPGDTDPSLASAHYRLGIVYEKQGKRDLARAEYQATLRLDPRQAEAREALGRLR